MSIRAIELVRLARRQAEDMEASVISDSKTAALMTTMYFPSPVRVFQILLLCSGMSCLSATGSLSKF